VSNIYYISNTSLVKNIRHLVIILTTIISKIDLFTVAFTVNYPFENSLNSLNLRIGNR